MRIAFLLVGNESRKGNTDGYSIRYGGASSSGTESSVIYVAEYLNSIGHQTTIALERCEEPVIGTERVLYTDFNFTGDDNKEYDVLISCLWFKDYDKLPIKVNKALIYWCHLAWGYSYGEMIQYCRNNGIKFGLVSISKWAQTHNAEIKQIVENSGIECLDTVIPNPVAVDVIKKVLQENHTRRDRKFIHHGQWSRGGDTALRAVGDLNWDNSQFKSFDYIDKQGGIDKITLFREIVTSEYFVYPQITHGRLVYKDTFSVSIAEAIGLGVIVVTYPLGAVPEYFGEYCQFLEYPNDVDVEKLQTERLSEEPKLDCIDNIVEKVKYLDSNPSIKQSIRARGIEYISNNFDIKNIGPIWVDFLKLFK